jgi:thiamine pyrophosphokinase
MEEFPLITAETPFDGVILANGDYPSHPIPTGILKNALILMCCDGAAVKALEHGLTPTWVVGDGDSLPAEYRERLAPQLGKRMRFVEDQSINDLTKCTRMLYNHVDHKMVYPDDSFHFAYVGATGKREDHTLGNIALMHYYRYHFGVKPTLITDHGYFVVAKGTARFQSRPGQQVSLFNIDCSSISSRGLRWEAYPFEMAWQGTLNEAVSGEFEIIADRCYLVYRTF